MEMTQASKQPTTHESEHAQNPELDQILSPRRSLELNQKKWWISVTLCLFLVMLGDSLVMLLLNFFYVQDKREDYNQDLQYKGTWMQALIQNAAFPILIPLFFIFTSPKPNQETNNTRFLTFRLILLYFSLGVLVAAHSKLFALGKLYSSYGFFLLISMSQLIFTVIFAAIINRFKFTRWIILSIILTLVSYAFGSPKFSGEPEESEYFYSIQAWLTFAASVALALTLCLAQLGFEKLLVKTKRYGNKKVFRMVLEMQISVSFVASLVCLVGLFASGEYKELKGDSKRFKKGETYYVLSLVGLALSWQVWSVGLIGLVLYVSGVFSDVVHMCASPLVALIVVFSFDFINDTISIQRIGARQSKWWISVALCLFLVLLGDSLVMLLLNFFYVQMEQDNQEIYDPDLQYKGTWTQALIQNIAFPIIIPLFFLFPKPKQNQETNNTRFLSFPLLFLYLSLGVLVAAHSKLFSLGKVYANYGIFILISATQLIFTAIFTAIINRFKFTRWIFLSIVITIVIYVFGSPEFGGAPDESEEKPYNIQAWLTFSASVSFSLSLCLVQLGFEKLLVKTKRYGNKKVFRMVLEMQICVSFVASVVCLVGLFASGEFKELKGDSERFKKGETYYVLSLVGLALSWQVWAAGLIGLVLYVSGLFGDVVHMCASPLVALFVVLAFDFMDDEFTWPRIGTLIGAAFALGSYFYTLHKRNKKKMVELY